MSSKYDEIHDNYWHSSTTKAGTRYERIVACVLKSLQAQDTVFHNIRMGGDSEVLHQIDVTVERYHGRKRVLVECKDFDVSGNKVGLSIIRDFSAVVEDINPDEAIVITCAGFTRDAQKFARYKGIKLVVLREFQDADSKGRIKTIQLDLHIWEVTKPRTSFLFEFPKHLDKFKSYLTRSGIGVFGVSKGDDVFINLPEGRMQLTDFVEKVTNGYPRDKPGPIRLKKSLQGNTLEVGSLGTIPIQGMTLEFEVRHSIEYLEIESKKIARLIIEGFGDKDIIIFDQELRRFNIDEKTGEIVM